VAIAAEVDAFLRSAGFADARVTAIEAGIEDVFMERMTATDQAAHG
jgi:hypothetical protein